MRRSFGWARCAPAVTCALMTWCVATTASADLRVGWDCFLPDAQVECGEVASAFFPSVPGVERQDAAEGDVAVSLRSVAVPSGRRYVADFGGAPATNGEMPSDAIAFSLVEQVPDAAGHDRTLMLLVALLQRGTVPFMHVPTPGEAEGGVLRLEATAGAQDLAAADQPSGDDARSGWYVRPEVSGELVSAGVQVASLSGGLEVSHSTRSLRWLLSGSGGYRHLDVTLPSGRLRGGFVQARGSTTLAHSIGGGFSVALLGGAQRQPQNNLDLRGEAGVGLEWVHREFLRADEGNFGARYRLHGVWDDYDTETVLGQRSRLYARQSLGLFARWHLDDVDLDADVGGGAVADQPELWDVGGELSATLRLAEGLELSVSGSILYRGGAVHEPADPSQLDPIASVVSGSDFGELTYATGLSLSYSFGNGLLRAQDQRWR